MPKRSLAGTVGLAVAAAIAITPNATAASAGQSAQLQRQVDHVIQNSAPGARQIAPNRVQWPRAGVTLTLDVPGKATAADVRDCPRRYACLWEDFEAEGRRVQFLRYRTYNLSNWGMPPHTPQGASSYANHQTGGAKAILHTHFAFSMRGHGNLVGFLNDRGKRITLRP
jgi:Peptidase inhibitor family I36